MAAFADELQACIDELGAPDAERTAIVRAPILRESKPRRVRAGTRSRWPLLLTILGLLVAAAVVAAVLTLGGASNKTHKTAPPPVNVHLRGVGSYDPDGDGSEHSYQVQLATDGNASTAWTTEHYRNFSKPGVGLVLDAGRSVALRHVTVATDNGGFEAQIQVGNDSGGGFVADSPWKSVDGTTSFALAGRSGRYYVVWLRLPSSGGIADVTEVRAG